MSVGTGAVAESANAPAKGTDATEPASIAARTEPCPLCGATLGTQQEWCLNCGAAARTRLAATPAWRAPVLVLVLVILGALGALTVALVSLAGQ